MIRYVMPAIPLGWFRQVSLGRKFFALFGVLLALLSASLAALLWYLFHINSYIERHHRITVPALVTTTTMRQHSLELSLLLHRLVEDTTPGTDKEIFSQSARIESELRQAHERYRTTHAARTHPVLLGMLTQHKRAGLADQEDNALNRIAALLDDLAPRLQKAHGLLQSKQAAAARRQLHEISRLTVQLNEALSSIVAIQAAITAEMKAEGNALLDQATQVMLVLIVGLAVMTALTYVIVSTQVAQPLKGLAVTADQVAHRDLSAQFEPWPAQDEVGRLARSLGTMLDTLREQTRSLERKTKELESFTYSTAHDLKGPLREIEGFSALLERKYSGQLEPTARHYLGMIRASTLKLTALIDALLRYSRLEQQSLPKSVVNIRAVINEIVAEQTRAASTKPVLSVDLPFDDLWGELASIRQALVNLIGNAIKFSRHANPPEISIGGRATGNEHILWIKDNGVGFEQHDAGRIFRLFERLHAPADYEGTGVGLAIVKLIMEKHGGRVWAESSPGKGSTFYLAFPEKPAAA